jgi:hypothetical protein
VRKKFFVGREVFLAVVDEVIVAGVAPAGVVESGENSQNIL